MVSAAQTNLINASLAPAQLSSQISASIASKSLDAAKQQGADVLKLLDSAGGESSTAGDPLVARATGLGSLLDVTA